MNRKTKNRIAKVIVQVFRIDELAFGEEVWLGLDAELPKATGISSCDEERISLFQQKIKSLDFLRYYVLGVFLRGQVYALTYHFDEFASIREEEIEQRLKQIYSQHLAVM